MLSSPASDTELTLAATMVAISLTLILGGLLRPLVARLRQPPVIGEVAAGIVLGPSLLGLLPGDLTGRLFPADVRSMLTAVAQVGVLLFLFMVGWEFEKRLLTGRRTMAVSVSLTSVVLSFGLGVALAFWLYGGHRDVGGTTISRTAFVLFIGAAMAITAFPVLARILTDRGLSRTPVGALALASAAIDDVLAWCILALVSAVATAGDGGDLAQIAALSVVYVLAMFALRPALAALVRRLGAGPGSPFLLGALVSGVFLSSYATTWIGIHAIFGAFLFGYIMPREPSADVEVQVRRPLEVVSMLLLPVFFIVTGLGVDISSLAGRNWLELAAVIAVACLGKFAGAVLPARALGLSWPETRTLGLLMNTRGLTELIILNAGRGLGILDTGMFTIMVIMALVTTAMAGPLLPRGPGGPGGPGGLPPDLVRAQPEQPEAGGVPAGPAAEVTAR